MPLQPGPSGDRSALITAAALIATLLAAPARGAPGELAAEVESGDAVPYRGTSIGLRSSATALSVAPQAELTYNPYVALTLDFTAAWWFTDWLYFLGRIDAQRELTQADDTTHAGEILLGDGLLQLGLAEPWRDPWLGIAVSSTAELVLPTSKRAWAETRVLSTAASLSLSRRWTEVLGIVDAVELGYSLRPSKAFHQFTTAGYQAPTIADCTSGGTGCEALLSSGLRNVSWSVEQTAVAALRVNELWGADFLVGTVTGFLYPLAEVEGLSNSVADPVDTRFLNYYRLRTTLAPLPGLSFALGASTVNPQLRPDGSYRLPLFNRFTQIFFDVRLDAAGLIAGVHEAEEYLR